MSDISVVTSCNFNDNEYLIKLVTYDDTLEISVTDKASAEEWECSYDKTYVESLTQKTGNYKKFSVFISMLKSALLKTSECVTLDLLSYEDLETLRIKKLRSRTKTLEHGVNNRKYLIVTYSVEFDRIHYPLPLEYTGPPNPQVLQNTIKKLRSEIQRLKDFNSREKKSGASKTISQLHRKVEELKQENYKLKNELHLLRNNNNIPNVDVMQKAIVNLEKSVLVERKSHHKLVEKLRNKNLSLTQQLNEVKKSELALRKTLSQIGPPLNTKPKNAESRQGSSKDDELHTLYRRKTFTNLRKSASPRNRRCQSCPVKNNGSECKNKSVNSSKCSTKSSRSSTRPSRSSSLSSYRSSDSRQKSNVTVRHTANCNDLEDKIHNLLELIQNGASIH